MILGSLRDLNIAELTKIYYSDLQSMQIQPTQKY